MPRAVKAKANWHAAGQVVPANLSKKAVANLCEAAGRNPASIEDRASCKRIVSGVAEAIGIYRHEAETDRTAPRPTHQRKALKQLDGLLDQLGCSD